MTIGIILLVLGIAVFVLSFLLPAKSEEEKEIEFSEDLIRDMVGKEVEGAKSQLNDIVDETINYAMEKTERSIDRLTNEKMMAVNEYSDTVLTEINKNHKEVVFLYDMLNDKHENLKDTVSEIDKKASEAKQAVMDAKIAAMETTEQIEVAREQAMEAIPAYGGEIKMSAIERLKASQKSRTDSDEDSAETVTLDETDNSFEPFSSEKLQKVEVVAEKPTRRKRTTKPKVREEAVSFSEDSDNRVGGELDIIQSETDGNQNIRKEGPNLNLGTDGVGQTLGGRNNKDKILELHEAGKSNVAIAKDLGLGIGEVNLVINLYEGM